MGKYFITGSPGVGKSTLIAELQRRGYNALDTERVPNASRLIDKLTGEITDHPAEPIDWTRYSWDWNRPVIDQLLNGNDEVFLAAVMSNQHEFYHVFDRIFVLMLDIESLRRRLLNRTSKSYGKQPDELKGILAYNEIRQTELLSEPNAVAINASSEVIAIADEIVSKLT